MSGADQPAPSTPAEDRRYWLSMAAVAVVTLLVAGLLGGTVTLLTSSHGSSVWGAATIVLVTLAGWRVGYRLRERKKLGLPLWRTLSDDDATTLAQYREWGRSGRIEDPSDQDVANAARGPVARPRSTGPGTVPLSRRDRDRAAQVRRARAARADRRDGTAVGGQAPGATGEPGAAGGPTRDGADGGSGRG